MHSRSTLCSFIWEEYLKPHSLLNNSLMTGTGHIQHIRWYQNQIFKTSYKTQSADGESNQTHKEMKSNFSQKVEHPVCQGCPKRV